MRREGSTLLIVVLVFGSCAVAAKDGYTPAHFNGGLKENIVLESGVPVQANWPDIPDLPAGQVGVDTTTQLTIAVPNGSESLLIVMEAANLERDFEIFVRFGQPIELTPQGQLLADYYDNTFKGLEEVGIWLSDLQVGTYYIALGTASRIGGAFTVTATIDAALANLKDKEAVPVAVPADEAPGDNYVWGDGTQFRIPIPASATSLYLRFQATDLAAETILAIRYLEPSIFDANGLQTDLIATFAGGFEEICFQGQEVLPNQDLYVWVLNNSGQVVKGTIEIAIDSCERPLAIGGSNADVARATGGHMLVPGRQHAIALPANAAELAALTVTVTATGDPRNLDFYIRKGTPVELDDQQQLVAEIKAREAGTAPETYVIECSELAAGARLYVDVENPGDAPVPYTIQVVASATPCGGGGTRFLRGDANTDAKRNVADAIAVLTYLFGRGQLVLTCLDAGDANDDEKVNVADAIALLGHLFGKTGPLPAPFDTCGTDPTSKPNPPDNIDCAQFPAAACP